MTLEQTIRLHVERLPLPLQGEVLDYVLALEQKVRRQPADDAARRARLAATLDRAVALNPFAETDPLAWERDQRQERSLPGRD